MIPVSQQGANQPNGQAGPLSQPAGTGVGSPTASAPGGSPKGMKRVRPPNTFAGMQQQGMARPSPEIVSQNQALNQQMAMMQQQGAQVYQPNAQQSLQAAQQTVDNASAGRNLGQFQYGGNVQTLSNPLMQQVMTLLSDPTQGLNEAAQSNFDRQNRVIGREFSTLRGDLNENMAARGLDASTIAASKLGELGARQAEAQSDLAARIQEKLIGDRASAMNSAINAALGFRGQEADMEKDIFTTNRDTSELGWRRNFDSAQAQQSAAQFEQRLALDSELGRGNLALNRDRFGFEVGRDARDFGYQQTRDAANDQFRNRDFEWRQDVDSRDFGYRQQRDAVGDSQWNRQFDYNQNRDNRDFSYRQDRDRIGDTQWQSQFDRQNTWRTEDNQYRDSRDTIGDQRYNDSWNRDETRYQQQWNNQTDNQRNQLLMGVLQGMGFNNLGPAAVNQILQTLGISLPGVGGSGVGGSGGGSPFLGGGTPRTDTFY